MGTKGGAKPQIGVHGPRHPLVPPLVGKSVVIHVFTWIAENTWITEVETVK